MANYDKSYETMCNPKQYNDLKIAVAFAELALHRHVQRLARQREGPLSNFPARLAQVPLYAMQTPADWFSPGFCVHLACHVPESVG